MLTVDGKIAICQIIAIKALTTTDIRTLKDSEGETRKTADIYNIIRS